MIPFLLRRLGATAAVLFVVATTCFALARSLPGGPFDSERSLPAAVEARLLAAYDLDAPLREQYVRWLSGVVLRGDLGPSMRYRDETVGDILAQSLPVSAALGAAALALALALGLTAGAIAAARPGTWIERSVQSASALGLALPNFIIAGVLLLLFALHWRLLPVAGSGGLEHLVLPALALGLPLAATVARLFRAGLLEVLGEDWVRTAHAKGLSPWRVLFAHAGRPACLPVVSALGPATAALLSGSLVIERVFALPGMGAHFVDSALHADYNLALGAVLVYALLLCLANLAADIAAGLLDPRIGGP